MPSQNRTVVATGHASRHSGFSLPEALVAALLLTVSLLGLLQYHQILQHAFLHQWQQRQAWRLAMQQLEAYEAGVKYTIPLDESLGANNKVNEKTSAPGTGRAWRSGWSEQAMSGQCRKATATVVTPGEYQVRLTRWFCLAVHSASE